MTMWTIISMPLSVALAAYVSVCLAKGELMGLRRALVTFVLAFRIGDDDAEFDQVVLNFGFFLSGLYWIFIPDMRWFVGLGWYALCLVLTYRLAHVHEHELAGFAGAVAVTMGPAFMPWSVWTDSHWPVVWYILAAGLVCWQVVCRELGPAMEYEALYENALE